MLTNQSMQKHSEQAESGIESGPMQLTRRHICQIQAKVLLKIYINNNLKHIHKHQQSIGMHMASLVGSLWVLWFPPTVQKHICRVNRWLVYNFYDVSMATLEWYRNPKIKAIYIYIYNLLGV